MGAESPDQFVKMRQQKQEMRTTVDRIVQEMRTALLACQKEQSDLHRQMSFWAGVSKKNSFRQQTVTEQALRQLDSNAQQQRNTMYELRQRQANQSVSLRNLQQNPALCPTTAQPVNPGLPINDRAIKR